MDFQEKLITDEIKKLIPVLGRVNAARLNRTYLLADEDTRKRIFELVDVVKAAVYTENEMRNVILLDPPSKKVASDGEIRIGEVLYGTKKMYPINLRKQAFLTHVAVFGSSGYGKTNISFDLIKQLSDSNIPVIVFDFSKRNYKDLLNTELRDRIEIFTIGRRVSPFKFNPLIPPEGISLSQWIKEFSAIFDHAYWLLGGGRHIILRALDAVYKINEIPKLKDLKAWLSEYGETKLPVRERNWLATAERPLESLSFKEVGEVFDCDVGITPDEFFKPGQVTLLELDALDINDKTFFIEIILQWIRDWLLVKDEREKLQGAIILEEAHHVLNREKATKLGTETVMDLVFREIRELGMSVIYLDQHPSLVSYPALGNTSTHIYMNLGLDTKHSSDIQDAANMLGLTWEEDINYIRKIPVGHGIMLSRMLQHPDPFLVKFDKFPIEKGSVSDEEIKEFMTGKIPEKVFESTPSEKVRKEGQKISVDNLDEQEWEIFRVIGEGKTAFASQIYKKVKMSGTVFNKRAAKLIQTGIMGFKTAKVGKNKLNYFFLTDAGEKVYYDIYGERSGKGRVNLEGILDMFDMAGWKWEEDGEGIYKINLGDYNIRIVIVNDLDYRKIYKSLQDNIVYYICGSNDIKNLVIQQAAKFSYLKENNFTIFVKTAEKFEKDGSFTKIEFLGKE